MCDCENRCGTTYHIDDLDPENPYVGPQDQEPVTIKDFVPLLIGLTIIVAIFVLIV